MKTGKLCSHAGCSMPHLAKGWCSGHYYRNRIGTDMNKPFRSAPRNTIPGANDFEGQQAYIKDRIQKISTGCWEWQRGQAQGYGIAYLKDFRPYAHRLSYSAFNEIDHDLLGPIHHTCNNRLCVNPAHLQEVTTADNNIEMLERQHYRKLIEELREELRKFDPNHRLLRTGG